MEKDIIIDDSEDDWRAVIRFDITQIYFYFESKASGETIKGRVNDTIGDGEEVTFVACRDVYFTFYDGMWCANIEDCPPEQIKKIKQPLVNFLTKLYFDNKEKFKKNIRKDLKVTF